MTNDIFNIKILPLILKFKVNSMDEELYSYKNYLYSVNALSKREKDELKLIIDKHVKAAPEDIHEIYDHYSEQYELYDVKYVQFANNGLLVNAYSFFEAEL